MPASSRLLSVLGALALVACNGGNPALEKPQTDGTAPQGDAGTADGGTTDASTTGCVAGRQEPCACADGRHGAQTCSADQTFGSCVCEGSDARPAPDAAPDGGNVPDARVFDGKVPPTDGGPEADAAAEVDARPDDAAVPPDAALPPCEPGAHREQTCGLNGRGNTPQTCTDGRWTDDSPCADPDQCVDASVLNSPCGLNLRGRAPQVCVAGQYAAPGECVDPDVCLDGAAQVAACGINGSGQVSETCAVGQWVPDQPCNDVDVCVNGTQEVGACGVLGHGTQLRDCANGQWGAYGACDDPDQMCVDGAVESVPCGLNRRGFQSHTCAGSRWGDFGPCEDPDACVDAARDAQACGLNARGARFRVCADGQWGAFGLCDDPDICADGSNDAQICGINGRGTQMRTCQVGQWAFSGGCVDPDVCLDGSVRNTPCGLNGRGNATATCVAGQFGPVGACVDPDECVIGSMQSQGCGPLGDGTQSRDCPNGHFGAWSPCLGATICPDPNNPACPMPSPERCNGLDDNFDGHVDEGLSGQVPVAGAFELAMEPVVEGALGWLRNREAGQGRFNSNAESTASVGLGTLAFLERRSANGVGPALGAAGLSQADRDMLVRVIRNQIADDSALTAPNGAVYVYTTALNVASMSRWLETGGTSDVGAAISVRAALQNGVDALRRLQGVGAQMWGTGSAGLDIEQSYMAASALSAASRVIPGVDASLARLGAGLDALQHPDGGFESGLGVADATVGATVSGIFLHRLAGTAVNDPRVQRALAFVAAHYVYDPTNLGFDSDATYWQPWNGTRAFQSYRLDYTAIPVGALDPSAWGFAAEPRGIWFDHARGLVARFQNGTWPITPTGGRSMLSLESLAILTMERSLGGANLPEQTLALPPACNDGLDDDADGRIDWPADPDCAHACSPTEGPSPACSNTRDDDADGRVDFPDDRGCLSALDNSEVDPACANGLDDDADGRTDWPADPGCENSRDTSEQDPAVIPLCSNGRDDDGDGLIDFGHDPECLQASQNDERLAPACAGQAPVLLTSRVTSVDGQTVGNDFQGSCGGVRGLDTLYAFVADVPMNVTFSTANDATQFDTVLYLRRTCDAAGIELACNDDVSAADPLSTLSVHLEPGVYFLVVDGKVGGGAFHLTISTTPLPPACGDGLDNDADGLVDALDPGCVSPEDPSEVNPAGPVACNNGRDDDADGRIDFPEDPGCATVGDLDERDPAPAPECANGIDDDRDGATDWPDDPSCRGRGDTSEFRTPDAACADFMDNDGDGAIDFPDDLGCQYPADRDETDPAQPAACSDGLDNDGDGDIDYPRDPGCGGRGDPDETDPAVAPVCANGRDDDGDGETDFPHDPGCDSAADRDETDPRFTPECADGLDNDLDGRTDWPDDPGCVAASDTLEATVGANPPRCSDGADNDDDGMVDLVDPGCMRASDDSETDPAGVPICANLVDDDRDGRTDWPADPQCQGSGDVTESLGCRVGVGPQAIPRNGNVLGSTIANGLNRYSAFCGGSTAPDSVYRYTLAAQHTLVISTQNPGTNFPTTLSVRPDCEEPGTELACAGGLAAPSPTITLPTAAPGDYYIFVDGSPTGAITSRGAPIPLPVDAQNFVATHNDLTAGQGWIDGGNDAFDNYGIVNFSTVAGAAATTIADQGPFAVGGGVTVQTTVDFPNNNILRYRVQQVAGPANARVTIDITGNLGSDNSTLVATAFANVAGTSYPYLRSTDGVPTDPPIIHWMVPSDPGDVGRVTYSLAAPDNTTITAVDVHLPVTFYLAPSYLPEGTVIGAIIANDLQTSVIPGAAFGNFEISVREQ